MFSQGIHFVLADIREEWRSSAGPSSQSPCATSLSHAGRGDVASVESLAFMVALATPPQPSVSSSPNPCNRCRHVRISHSTVWHGEGGRMKGGKACSPPSPAWVHSRAVATMPCIAPGRWELGLNGGCKRTLSIHVLDGPPLVAMHAFSIQIWLHFPLKACTAIKNKKTKHTTLKAGDF